MDLVRQLSSPETGILLQPSVRFDNLDGVSRGCQNLGNEFVRVQRDRRHQLLQLFRGYLHRLDYRRRQSRARERTDARSCFTNIMIHSPC
jgi:hypothetical protein